MQVRLIGGALDGATIGDPVVQSIWVRRRPDGDIGYLERPAAGYALYRREGEAIYVHAVGQAKVA